MTTVAFRAGILACDTMSSWGTLKVGVETKIFRIPDGLAGFAGETGEFAKLLEWLANGREGKFPFPGKSGPDCILALADGSLSTLEGMGQFVPVTEGFVAIGSGKPVAYGAFHMGASAAQAVSAAIKFDLRTGGKVRTLKLPRALNKG